MVTPCQKPSDDFIYLATGQPSRQKDIAIRNRSSQCFVVFSQFIRVKCLFHIDHSKFYRTA